ncbi:MAG TPA: glutamate racemase [Rhodocyclaceae bacterium]|jgi:glutamate racemase|nr:glutamate racemase [Rhodocyclaceae bacterium]
MNQRPIGVFDSGVGGLSVVREIVKLMPAESLHYVADTAHCPYGEKPVEYLRERAMQISNYLVGEGVKAIVVACNTATVATIGTLRANFSLPIIGIEPAIRPAAANTKSGVIGVLATAATLGSAHLVALIERHTDYHEVVTSACPGWVEAVEAGDLDSSATRALVRASVQPLLEAGADTLVLGCTHFPFLRQLIEDVAGPSIHILETGLPVARQLQRRLLSEQLFAQLVGTVPQHTFLSTALPQRQAEFVRRYWPNVGAIAQSLI